MAGGGVGNNILPAIAELHAILTSPTGPSVRGRLYRRAYHRHPPACPAPSSRQPYRRTQRPRSVPRRAMAPPATDTRRHPWKRLQAAAAGGCAAVGALQSALGKDYVLHAHRRGARRRRGRRVGAAVGVRGCGRAGASALWGRWMHNASEVEAHPRGGQHWHKDSYWSHRRLRHHQPRWAMLECAAS